MCLQQWHQACSFSRHAAPPSRHLCPPSAPTALPARPHPPVPPPGSCPAPADSHLRFGARALSNIIYSAASMGLRPDYDMLHAVARAVVWEADDFQPQVGGLVAGWLGGWLLRRGRREGGGGGREGGRYQLEGGDDQGQSARSSRQQGDAGLPLLACSQLHHCPNPPPRVPCLHLPAGPGQHCVGAGKDGRAGDSRDPTDGGGAQPGDGGPADRQQAQGCARSHAAARRACLPGETGPPCVGSAAADRLLCCFLIMGACWLPHPACLSACLQAPLPPRTSPTRCMAWCTWG
jgi:hypothetical protein